MKTIKFEITKKFTTGLLKGMTIEDTSPVPFTIGKIYKGLRGSGNYLVLDCKKRY